MDSIHILPKTKDEGNSLFDGLFRSPLSNQNQNYTTLEKRVQYLETHTSNFNGTLLCMFTIGCIFNYLSRR